MHQMDMWLSDYENRKAKKLKEPWQDNWQSNKYDFSDPNVRLEHTEMGCSVGACMSALKKSWRAFDIAGRRGEPRGDIAWRINQLKDILGLELTEFEEYPGIYQSHEDEEELQLKQEEQQESDGYYETSEETDEWSTEDKQLKSEDHRELIEELRSEEW